MVDENGKAAVAPTGEGIVGDVVIPPWWNDPMEAAREQVRTLHVIAQQLTAMNAKLARLESLVPQAGRPLAGLFGPRR